MTGKTVLTDQESVPGKGSRCTMFEQPADPRIDVATLDQLVERIADRVVEKLAGRRDPTEGEKLIGRHDLAKATGMSIATIDRRVSANEIPFYRSGRRITFKLSEVMASIKQEVMDSTAS